MKKSELKKLIREMIEEIGQEFYKNQLYLKATGSNRYAGGSTNWLRIRRIEDRGDEYEFYVVIQGSEKSVGVPKKFIDAGNGIPNLRFKVRDMPATVDTVLMHYFGKSIHS